MSVKKSVGRITAYAAAVSAGYTGTYRQFCEDQANFAKNAQQVASDRKAAEQVKTDVEWIKRETENITSDALSEVETAKNTAVQEIGNTAAAEVSGVNAAGKAQVEAVRNEGTVQVGNVGTAGSAAVEDVYAAAEVKKAEISDIGTVLVGEQNLTVAQAARVKSNLDAADGIIETASGEVIVIDDASDQHLRGLKLYGKSVQDGVPSPDAPVPIVSAGDDGSVDVTVAARNLIPFPYAESDKSADGITWTVNPDGSVTANGTSEQTVYFHLSRGIEWLNADDIPGETQGAFTAPATVSGKTLSQCAYNKKTLTLYLRIGAGETVTNKVFYPTIHIGDTVLPFDAGKPLQSLSVSTPNGLPGVPVTSGGNYTDADGQMWVCDEVDFARGVYVQRIGEKIFEGKETVSLYRTFDGGCVFQISDATNAIPNRLKASRGMYCSHFSETYTSPSSAPILNTIYNGTAVNFSAPFASVSDFTGWMAEQYAAGAPMVLKYVLAEPTETPLSEAELAAYRALHTNKPNTTIYADDNAGIAVEYAVDTKRYIDKKFEALQYALLSTGGNI